MHQARVVELTFGRRSQGSGYLVGARLVLTARHVIGTRPRVGEACRVRPLIGWDAAAQRVLPPPQPLPARVAWLAADATLDAALVELEAPLALPGGVGFARIPPGNAAPWRFTGTGFPEATGERGHPFFGNATDLGLPPLLALHIDGALPADVRSWAGASGTVVFCEEQVIGVVQTVDTRFDGRLTAVPITRLLDEPGFSDAWAARGEPPIRLQPLGGAPDPLDEITEQVHRIDRRPTVEAAMAQLQQIVVPGAGAAASAPAPKVLVVAGLEHDLHAKLMLRLAQSGEVQRLLGREARADDVIVPLPWPGDEVIREPGEALVQLLGPLFAALHLDEPAPAALEGEPLRQMLARRLDERSSPNSCWTLVRRGIARAGHAALLQQLLALWNALPTRRPRALFLCLAMDDPPPPRRPLLSLFSRSEPAAAAEDFDAALAGFADRLALLPQLDDIRPTDVSEWIDELRRSCRHSSAAQIERFGAALAGRIGPGAPLRRLLAELDAAFHGSRAER